MAHRINNMLTYKLHDDPLNLAASKYIHGKLLDIGCGIKAYEKMMQPYVSEHIGLDHEASLHHNKNVDLVGTAYDIPSSNSFFDSVICTSVLEHLEDPEIALKECYRVLKSGGYAIYTVPFIWPIHEEPRDFYRFSKYGLDYLFKKVGFEVIQLDALCGFWATFGQMFVYNLYRYNRGPIRWFRIVDLVSVPLQSIFYILDRLDKSELITSLYITVARKNVY